MSDATIGGTPSTERIDGYLRGANFLRMLADVVAVVLRHAAWLVFALLLVVALDASFGWGRRWLLGLDAALLAIVGLALVSVVGVLWRRRYRSLRTAAELERALGVEDSRLVNAVDLGAHASPGASEALRGEAVKRADAMVTDLPHGAAVDRAALGRAVRLLAIALTLLALGYFVYPRVFHAVIPRLVQPGADHPPFTLLTFGVTTQPEQVIQGRPAAIRIAIDGPVLPDQATLVWVDGEQETGRVPLLRAAPGKGDDADAQHYVLRLAKAEASRRFYVTTPEGRSKRYTLDVLPVPLFEEVRVHYEFPPYTGWPATREPLGAGGIKALEGTTATLEVRSNVGLTGGTLRLGDRVTSLGVDPQNPAHGTFAFAVATDGELDAVLESAGLSTPEPLKVPVKAVGDEKPRVSITEPAQTLVAPEGWQVDVKIAASDDVGMSRLTLHRAVNGLAPSPIELPRTGDAKDARRFDAAYRFDLARLGARAGDVITYFATAYDNKAPEPQFTQSEVFVIQVVSLAEYEEFARTQYRIDDLQAEMAEFMAKLDELEARREHALNELAQLQEELAGGGPIAPEQQARAEALEAELDAYRREALGLAKEMRERAEQNGLYDFEAAYKDELRRTEQELQMQASEADATRRALREMRQQPASPDASQRMAMQAERFRERDQPFDEGMAEQREQMAQDMETVALADEMAGAAERIRQVVTQQRDLAERMAQFAGKQELTPEEQRQASKLAQEQSDLRRELADAERRLREASERAAEALPKMSASAGQLLEKLGAMGVDADQELAETSAYTGRGGAAADAARSAADKLESLLSDSQQMAGNAPGELDGCLGLPREGWGSAMKQLAQGRGVPGLGQQGGEGTGFSGSAARMAVVGPAPQGEGEGPGRSSVKPAQGSAKGGASAEEDEGDGAERIEAEATEGRTRGVTALGGVPSQYRDAAEAYFRRIAEDERYDDGAEGDPR